MASVKYSRAFSRFPAQEGDVKGKEGAVNHEHTHMQRAHANDIAEAQLLLTNL